MPCWRRRWCVKTFQPSSTILAWQLPGGENYRETLLTMPRKDARAGETMQ